MSINTVISSDQVEGTAVYSSAGDKLGSIEELMIDKRTGLVRYAVLEFGGFLGMGGRLVAVPLGDLRWNTERSQMVMPGATKEALQTRTAFDYDTVRSR